MVTEKLFYQDGYIKEFDASVISCEETKGGYQVVLDRTGFFPEGGGQYADPGRISGAEVLDVQEEDGVIYHTVNAPLEAGSAVHGRLDWDIRFERMQQHTGEHIISGIVHGRFGYENVGFHLGGDYCTMDFNGPITREELKEIELEANKAVFRNLAVEITYPSKEALASMEYRSKIEIEGQVRIITIPGYDVCACCAPHLRTTGEIGLIKLVNMINYKGGERITMLCGFRALKDYQVKDENIKAVSALLSAKEYEAADAVTHLKEEAGSLKGKIASLQQKLLSYQAAGIPVDEDITVVFDDGLSQNAPRDLMNLLLGKGAGIAAVFAGTPKEGYRYVIGSRETDVRLLCRKLNEEFKGRGGGKPEMVQGSLHGDEAAIRASLRACSFEHFS